MLSEAPVDGQDGLEKLGEKVFDGVRLEKSLCCSMNDGCLGKINLEKFVEENRTIPTSVRKGEGFGPNILVQIGEKNRNEQKYC